MSDADDYLDCLGYAPAPWGPTETELRIASDYPKTGPRLMFVSKKLTSEAEELFQKILSAMNLHQQDIAIVYLANEHSEETLSLNSPSTIDLIQKIKSASPEIIVALGAEVAQLLLNKNDHIANLRNSFHPLPNHQNIQVMPTFAPDLCLRQNAMKKPVWEDLKLVLNALMRPKRTI